MCFMEICHKLINYRSERYWSLNVGSHENVCSQLTDDPGLRNAVGPKLSMISQALRILRIYVL